jgi:DNA-binding NarL/FixJ family response regulator
LAGKNILIVEDDPNWQAIFSEIVADLGFKPVVAGTLQTALSELGSHPFVLAIIDISLSEPYFADRSGVAVLKEIARVSAGLPAVVVTGYATVDLAVETLVDLNAVHFFQKDKFNRREFGQVVQEQVLNIETADGATDALQEESDLLSALTDREREVLDLLIQGQTNKQIAESLTVTVNTIKKHVQSIFTKLNVDNRAAAVAKALNTDR